MTIFNKQHRIQFLDAINRNMGLVPTFNMAELCEKARDEIEQSGLPEDARSFMTKYPEIVKRDKCIWIDLGNTHFRSRGENWDRQADTDSFSSYIWHCHLYCDPPQGTIKPAVDSIKEIYLDWLDQKQARYEILSRVRETLEACKTFKRVREAFPELEALMPAEPMKVALPAVINGSPLLADLIKAGLKIPPK